MDSWRFHITAVAENDFSRLDTPIRKRVKEHLKWFQEHFEEIVPLPLGGTLAGFFKLRIGDWRIVYQIENEKWLVTVHVVDRRDQVYRRKISI